MSVMVNPSISRSTPRSILNRGGILLFWGLGALAVAVVDQSLGPVSIAACSAAKVAVIIVAAFGYMRWCGKELTVGHALLVGVSWFILDVTAEVVLAEDLGHGWFELLGSPEQPALRLILLAAWLAAPALFANSGEMTGGPGESSL